MSVASSPQKFDESLAKASPGQAWRLLSHAAARLHFLRSPTARLLLAGLILPNLLSLASLSTLIDIGLPPRTTCILLYAVLAIWAQRFPAPLTAVLFLALLCYDLISTLALMFNLAPSELLAALDQAKRIHFLSSPLYICLIGVMMVTTAFALYLLTRREKLAHGNIIFLFAAALAFAALDYVTNISPQYYFGSFFGKHVPVVSAADASGFNKVAGTNGRNVVLVIVESLGYMTDPAKRARIDEPLSATSVTRKYAVSSGTATYYGSTTSGEMRELCETRAFYSDYAPKFGYSCLPELLHQRGYNSLAVHAFSGGMFERDQWYPRVGFDKELFGSELVKKTGRVCGSAFRGACDSDLAPVIAQEARKFAPADKPRFIYWLTLNTHIPVAPGDARTNFNCASPKNPFGQATVCRMAELWHDLFGAVAQLALNPAIGPADILVVGDHAPPLWSKRGRSMFAPGKVAWYRLTPRADAVSANGTTWLSSQSILGASHPVLVNAASVIGGSRPEIAR